MTDMQEKTLGRSELEQPWMCNCGYEGDRDVDGGECPKCHGMGECPWNG